MHMADALISPIIGGSMWAATAGVATYSIKKVQNELDEKKIPLMGVMGAFVFAAQMINFSIPGTGSSGHIGGGMLLAILLGPYAGFLTMASILTIQALFFADGGLVALGCNIFNLGFYTCFIIYPLIYKSTINKGVSKGKIIIMSLISSVLALQFGAFSVVLETFFSGKTELPFSTFVILMQPIHLAIGIVEGIVTGTIITFLWKARPELFESSNNKIINNKITFKKVLVSMVVATIIVGGGLSWFASNNPDGLKWSMLKITGKTELQAANGVNEKAASIQKSTAILPDYGFKQSESEIQGENKSNNTWASAKIGTTVSGIVGAAMTLTFSVIVGFTISFFKKKKTKACN